MAQHVANSVGSTAMIVFKAAMQQHVQSSCSVIGGSAVDKEASVICSDLTLSVRYPFYKSLLVVFRSAMQLSMSHLQLGDKVYIQSRYTYWPPKVNPD